HDHSAGATTQECGFHGPGLHRLETMREGLAYRQRLLPLLQLDPHVSDHVAHDAGDRVDIDQRAAMNLPEYLRIELVEELLDRMADHRFLPGREHHGVLVVRLQVADLVDGDEPQFATDRSGDPAQVLLAAADA